MENIGESNTMEESGEGYDENENEDGDASKQNENIPDRMPSMATGALVEEHVDRESSTEIVSECRTG